MLNNITLMGRLTAEPDYRTTQSGVPLAKFTLAVERDYSGQNGERVTDFLDVDAWRQTADFVSKYFHKGQLVAVVGSVQVENFTDRDGNKRRSWTVQAQHCYFAEPKRDGQPAQTQGYQQQPQNGYNSRQQPYNGQQQHNVNVTTGSSPTTGRIISSHIRHSRAISSRRTAIRGSSSPTACSRRIMTTICRSDVR